MRLPLGQVMGLYCVEKTGTSITIAWDAVKDASGYEVMANGSWTKITGTTYTATGLTVNTTYTFIVRAVNDDQVGLESDPLIVRTFIYNPQTPYATWFYNQAEEQMWLIDELENILNIQGKSMNTIESREDFESVYALGLANRRIEGKIPKAIGELYNLQYLYLGNNTLSGALPGELYTLKNLVNLDLSQNRLTGAISEQISELTKLRVLMLHQNQFVGPLPNALGSLVNLENLDVASNQLTGGIPANIGNLTKLRFLSLADNQFTGDLPESFSALANLEVLVLSNNNFNADMLMALSRSSKIRLLDLSNNQFTGDISAAINRLISSLGDI